MQRDGWVIRVASRRLSRRRFLNATAFAGLGAAGLALVGCGDDDDDGEAAPATAEAPAEPPVTAVRGSVVNVTLSDSKIELSSGSAEPGPVTFVVTNNGPADHQLVVLGNNLRTPTGLPLTADRTQVDEAGRGIAASYKIDPIPAGATQELSVPDMPGGLYLLICNIPEHYQQGERRAFLVGEGVTLGN